MNDAVEIKPDKGSQSLGKNAYLFNPATQFDRSYKSSLYIAIALSIALFVAMSFTKDMGHSRFGDQPIKTPEVDYRSASINPKLLTERDLRTNTIGSQRPRPSHLGKIKIVSLRGEAFLPVGTEMKAVLSSGASDGIVRARLTQKVLVDGEVVLPERTTLFGHGVSGEERLFVEFKKAILPNGESHEILAQALDSSDSILGLKGAFVGRKTKKMAGAIGFGFLGGMMQGFQTDSSLLGRRPTARDAALSGASKAALDQSTYFMEEMRNAKNTIEVKLGSPILVIVDEPRKDER